MGQTDESPADGICDDTFGTIMHEYGQNVITSNMAFHFETFHPMDSLLNSG